MKHQISIVTLVLISFMAVRALQAQNAPVKSDTACRIVITYPSQDGFNVGPSGQVIGQAFNIPKGQYLWVLCHRKDLEGQWWPQNWSKVDPTTHEWSVTVYFGTPGGDRGQEFEIAAIIVNSEAHADWKNYIFDYGPKNNYPPQQMETSNCIQYRTVRKSQ